ncbi:hypothetical protein BC830DRAFT_1064313 [Chytriomyces sp. MP71]|nr:hypothetical protein BC830DRAFT_1064313 [Chytriomyces sp. MP71]
MPIPNSVLVTGANKGIGLAAVKLLSAQLPSSSLVFLGCRNVADGEAAIAHLATKGNVRVVQIDVASEASIHAAVLAVRTVLATEAPNHATLDVLINNAGIATPDYDNVLRVNVDGPWNSMHAFLPLLTPKTGRFVVVASEVGAWTLNTFPADLQRVLEDIPNLSWETIQSLKQDWLRFSRAQGTEPADHGKDFQVNVVCPGYCSTALNGFKGFRTVEQGGASIIWPLFNESECQNGGFYRDGIINPWNLARPEIIPH